jgi:hypothetical protein
VVRSECKLFFICSSFAESKECEEWDIGNCVFVIWGRKCWLLCQVMYRTTYCSCRHLPLHMSAMYSVPWAHALECVYVHHRIFQCSHTIIRWTCRLFCSRALKWIEYYVRVRVVSVKISIHISTCFCFVGYRSVVVFYAYSTPTKVAAVVCSGWAVLGRGPQGIVARQSGACRVRCRNECRNECMNVSAVLTAFFIY